MAIVRSYQNGFELQDRTEDLLIIPNNWGLTQQLGIFDAEGVAEHTVLIEEITQSGAKILDRVRGERATVGKDYPRKMHAFPVPHFPFDDYIMPQDVQGKRAYGSESAETLAAVRARKMERIRRAHAWTLEVGRMQALTAGTVYAPNGTVSIDWYSSFGITRKEVDFDLDTSTTEVLGKIEEVVAHIQDNLTSGEMASEFVGICSPDFFSKLIKHPTVKTAYQYYASTQEPLRNRLTAAGMDARYREFIYGGIRFIEYRGSYEGTALVPANDAYFLPVGTMDTFKTYFGPANKFEIVNTIGEEVYMFEYASMKGDKIEIETETNFLNVLRRPAAVVRGYTG